MNLIATTIRDYRSRSGLTHRGLSALIGISYAQIWQLENGNDLPTLPSLQAIARFFHLTPEQIGKFILTADIPPRRDSALNRPRRARSA